MPEKQQEVCFILKDRDNTTLPNRTVNSELEGLGKIDKTLLTVDVNGKGEITYRTLKENTEAKIILVHKYEYTAGNDNIIFVDSVDINTSGKLWRLVNHSTRRKEIIVIGEHIGPLEMMWDKSCIAHSFLKTSAS